MSDTLSLLVAAATVFVGTHFLLSHPLRAPIATRIGERGFQALYSLVALATFVWMVCAFRTVPMEPQLWNGQAVLPWLVASLLTVVALVLFIGSLRGNPALPDPHAGEGLAERQPAGVFRITRHPMMWGFALWAIAHVLVAPTSRTLVLTFAIGFLALIGAHLQDRKKEALMGAGWAAWVAKTSYWPRWSALPRTGAMLWIVAAALWLLITWAHVWLAYVPAGPWRWAG